MILWVNTGLTSRCVSLIQAYYLLKKYHKDERLVIIWPIGNDCNIRYEEVFDKEQFSDLDIKVLDPPPAFIPKNIPSLVKKRDYVGIIREIINRVKNSLYKKIILLKYNYINYIPDRTIGWSGERFSKHCMDSWNSCRKGLEKKKELFICAYSELIFEPEMRKGNEFDYQVIKFADRWVKKAELIVSEDEEYIGIHIRRTDHSTAIAHSKLETFILMIQERLQENPNTRFFLATDDNEVERELKKTFGDRIVIQPDKHWGRDSEEGMESAIIDLLCLSRCKVILGSYASGFSVFPARYGNKELIICE